MLAESVDLHVFFAHRQLPEHQAEAGFGIPFEWDSNLLTGFEYSFLDNRSRNPGTTRYSGCDTPQIAASLESGRFDAVLTMGWYLKSYVQALMTCGRAGLRSMVRGDSTLAASRGPIVPLLKRLLYPALLRRIDAFLVVGRQSRSYLESFGVTDDRMFWSPHSVDNDWFARRAHESIDSLASIRADLGCRPHEMIVLFVGKFIQCKRPMDLVRALATLRERGVPVRGVFVGHGELYSEIRRIGDRIEAPIELVGFKNQSELPAIYAAADLLVLSSDRETWGLVVNEAMACGTPAIVSSAVGCADDLIEPGVTGFQYPVGDIDALAGAIERLLPIAGSDLMKNALARKSSEYSLERAVDGILNAIGNGRAR
jgi:glycosyltransferase involved in cell wall biosynthesis